MNATILAWSDLKCQCRVLEAQLFRPLGYRGALTEAPASYSIPRHVACGS